ncbi:hypothetical protein CTAYLR_008178 [Chrysophaeum taylorii]|uniref:Vesicle-fusing ATPase n=1 Tax=Chrysophaeum taylorii TaxID=2483200 RepID=A0AAD7XLM8_9STRA|nr:hypothetical protein CTAYLR_008178 [Chrysophaeum taylorii]
MAAVEPESWKDKAKKTGSRVASRRKVLYADHQLRKEMAARGEVYKGDGVLLDNKGEEEDTVIRKIAAASEAAALLSTGEGQESSGTGRYSWGTWVDEDKLRAVVEAVDAARLRAGDAFWDELFFDEADSSSSSSSSYKAVKLTEGKGYDATLRAFRGAHRQVFQFPAGSHVVLKPLYGSVVFQKLRRGRDEALTALGRARELNGAGRTSDEAGDAFRVLGGPPHSLAGQSRAAVLEVVLRPPTGDDGEISDAEEKCSRYARLVEEGLCRVGDDSSDDASDDVRRNLAAATAKSLKGNVGGLEAQLEAIVRRVLASRADPEAARRLGVSHVRGVLLSGPPGCGKTLLARHLAKELGAREPRIVNGPEILDKFVGEAERKVRELFAPAEAEFERVGDRSALHVIILDEMDAIARHRGSLAGDTTGVRDGVVNMLLAKMDGVQELPNVLVVGLTNRPELIDDALKRPGRLEVHVTIDRPDRAGRRDILRIHTRAMRENGALAPEAAAAIDGLADDDLPARARDFSGAELAGLVRSAASFALGRAADAGGPATLAIGDFDHALDELASRANSDAEIFARSAGGLRGAWAANVRGELEAFTTTADLVSLLVVPETPGAGATTLVAAAAVDAKISISDLFVDFVDAADRRLVDGGFDRVFAEGRDNLLVVLDDVDLAGDAVALRALCRRPRPRRSLKILATASTPDPPRDVLAAFDSVLFVPGVRDPRDVSDLLRPVFPNKLVADHLAAELAASLARPPVGCKRILAAAQRAKARHLLFRNKDEQEEEEDIDFLAQTFVEYLRRDVLLFAPHKIPQ